jgi:hypothetical protein
LSLHCGEKIKVDSMNSDEQLCNSTYADQMHIAERELSSFIRAVTQLFGPEEAKLSAEDWLEECELMDSPPLSTSRNWRAVTIAASARLANRLASRSIADQIATFAQGFVGSLRGGRAAAGGMKPF